MRNKFAETKEDGDLKSCTSNTEECSTPWYTLNWGISHFSPFCPVVQEYKNDDAIK